MSLEQIVIRCETRQVVFWGCFDFLEKTRAQHPFDIAFVVDINPHLHGTGNYHGYDVRDPCVLADRDLHGGKFVIITSSAFYEISEQLEVYGYRPGHDFAVAPVLGNFRIIDEIYRCRTQILLSSSDSVSSRPRHGGGLYLLDCQTGNYRKVLSGMCRGFARYRDGILVVDAQRGIRTVDRQWKETGCYSLPSGSVPHGVAIDDANGLLYVVLSIQDRIGIFDMNNYIEVRSITLTDKYQRSEHTRYAHHMNDIALDGDSLYISMFSVTGSLQRGWLNGGVVEYDLNKGCLVGVVEDRLWQPHSVRIIGGDLCLLDSMRGGLHLDAGMVETNFNGFVRGLAHDGNYYIIGQSVHRYFDRLQGKSRNISVDAGVFLYHRATAASRFIGTPTLRDINTLDVYNI